MTVLFLRLSFLSTFWEKLFTQLFNKNANNYVMSYVTPYLFKHAEYPPLVCH